ncbi:hypothetical protein [Ectothiorhodospira marina]|uniref:DUF3619 family protein n=1 Tax=Ectothiorhodospira marina TaxID=1396821 RepID=A0A1H7PXY6_9GAMM|nr:hypothetical protein [Ectothiorhodospira marina]SEL40700.1 hypothetical protein SAMN05444515_11562 [Ectothiorhodospira marina]
MSPERHSPAHRAPEKNSRAVVDDSAALLERVRHTLDDQATLTGSEQARLRHARRQALSSSRHPVPSRWFPAGGLALAASLMLTVAVWFALEPDRGHEPLPLALAEMEDVEWLMESEDPFWVADLDDPAFVLWAMEEGR